jgi:catechol 2,3-dioxygenase-like lactoylglutathione lyase family enzyme
MSKLCRTFSRRGWCAEKYHWYSSCGRSCRRSTGQHRFHGGVLDLPLVKLTVNFDDPATYHLCPGIAGHYSDVFPVARQYARAHRDAASQFDLLCRAGGRSGTISGFLGALSWRAQHRLQAGLFVVWRAGAVVCRSDGLRLELVSTPHSNPDRIWKHSLVPPEFAICGFHHVTLSRRRDTKEPRLF